MARYAAQAVVLITMMVILWDKDKRGMGWHYWAVLGLLIANKYMF